MTREDVIAKIQALFNITEANGSSKQEAISAALMAQRFISKYDIQENELFTVEDYEVVEVASDPVFRKFKYTLANTISKNYRCRYYITSVGRKHCITFVGRTVDATAASLIFNKLYEAVNDYANSESRKYRGQGGGLYGLYFNSAALAFISGIESELEKQSKELMLIRSKEVDEKFEEITSGFKRQKNTSMNTAGFVNYEKGFQAGRDAIRSSRLNGDSFKKFSNI